MVKIDKAGQMRVGQHTQRSGNAQVAARGFGAARPIADQQLVGIKELGQSQGGTFTRIEESKGGIGWRVRPRFEREPGAEQFRCVRRRALPRLSIPSNT